MLKLHPLRFFINRQKNLYTQKLEINRISIHQICNCSNATARGYHTLLVHTSVECSDLLVTKLRAVLVKGIRIPCELDTLPNQNGHMPVMSSVWTNLIGPLELMSVATHCPVPATSTRTMGCRLAETVSQTFKMGRFNAHFSVSKVILHTL